MVWWWGLSQLQEGAFMWINKPNNTSKNAHRPSPFAIVFCSKVGSNLQNLGPVFHQVP